jgi:ankyrin repeat protein
MSKLTIANMIMLLGGVMIACEAATSDDLTDVLIKAVGEGNLQMVQGLLKKGVSANSADKHGHTALMHAAQEGHLQVIELLLDHGADVNAGADSLGTALMKVRNIDAAKLILDSGADVNT